MADIALSAFSVFFMQSPSFLDFQRTMGRTKGRHNAASLFGVQQVPSDNHIRSMLDAVEPESIYPIFDALLDRLGQAGVLEQLRSVANDLVIVLDGTQYFRSDRLHCPQCHVTHHTNGKISYHHSLITPALVKPGRTDAIALAPEFIRSDDGAEKAERVRTMGPEEVIAVGNGRNDLPMLQVAGLSVAVVGPEGAAAGLLQAADVVTRTITEALDLILHPLRLKATLRD